MLSLENDLTVRAKTTEVAVKDFSSGSYATIFNDEVVLYYKFCEAINIYVMVCFSHYSLFIDIDGSILVGPCSFHVW